MEKLQEVLKKKHPFIAHMDVKHSVDCTVKKFPKLNKYKKELEFSYRLFLYCCVLGQKNDMELCGPGDILDEVWHAHILHSEQYHFQCNKIFGSYLHHNPEDDTSGKKESSSAFVEMIKVLIKKEHGWLEGAIPIIKLFNDTKLTECSCIKR